MEEKANQLEIIGKNGIEVSSSTISGLIYVIRDKPVLLDQDLAMLYQVETGALNRAVNPCSQQYSRVMSLDRETVYHIGASIKDAGKNVSGFHCGMIQEQSPICWKD